ncbi:glycosyltransferase [Nonomuraea lactucae]|uniref:glycosyltransferase n=1 Tax=Nonomuraea lactucae TaxID=2249762 RepID=UPI0013B46A7C|nr:glycosyltransferase [Nonomuraea lactucae]
MSNAIDEQRIRSLADRRDDLRHALGWDHRLVVLGVGQIQPRKGVEEFVSCARSLPHLRFVWVGGMQFGMLSDARHDLTRLRANATDNVTFTGLVPREKVFEYCVAADVFFLPSKHETFGLATLEAATAALPLVGPDLPCYWEWLRDARTVTESVELLRGMEDAKARATWAALASAAHGARLADADGRPARRVSPRRGAASAVRRSVKTVTREAGDLRRAVSAHMTEFTAVWCSCFLRDANSSGRGPYSSPMSRPDVSGGGESVMSRADHRHRSLSVRGGMPGLRARWRGGAFAGRR